MSIDVEDYFQVEAFSDIVSRDSWHAYPLRVGDNTRRILDMLDDFDVKATFFFLGWIAHKMPELVQEVARRGHEIACHSYWHHPIYRLTPAKFREDTRNALHAIEDAGGERVLGYRAPTWSITRDSLWAIEILCEEGFYYDSSIYPIHHDLYGIPGAKRTPYAWRFGEKILMEFPPATLEVGNTVLPAAGGGYLRIFPLLYTQTAIRRIEESNQRAVVYFHPWEIDASQPRLAGKWKSRLRHYTGLSSMERNLRTILAQHKFTSFERVWREASVYSPSMPVPAHDLAIAV